MFLVASDLLVIFITFRFLCTARKKNFCHDLGYAGRMWDAACNLRSGRWRCAKTIAWRPGGPNRVRQLHSAEIELYETNNREEQELINPCSWLARWLAAGREIKGPGTSRGLLYFMRLINP
jgi:hypothetical protein